MYGLRVLISIPRLVFLPVNLLAYHLDNQQVNLLQGLRNPQANPRGFLRYPRVSHHQFLHNRHDCQRVFVQISTLDTLQASPLVNRLRDP